MWWSYVPGCAYRSVAGIFGPQGRSLGFSWVCTPCDADDEGSLRDRIRLHVWEN